MGHALTVSQVVRIEGFNAVGVEAGQNVHERFQALNGSCQIGLCAPQAMQSYGIDTKRQCKRLSFLTKGVYMGIVSDRK